MMPSWSPSVARRPLAEKHRHGEWPRKGRSAVRIHARSPKTADRTSPRDPAGSGVEPWRGREPVRSGPAAVAEPQISAADAFSRARRSSGNAGQCRRTAVSPSASRLRLKVRSGCLFALSLFNPLLLRKRTTDPTWRRPRRSSQDGKEKPRRLSTADVHSRTLLSAAGADGRSPGFKGVRDVAALRRAERNRSACPGSFNILGQTQLAKSAAQMSEPTKKSGWGRGVHHSAPLVGASAVDPYTIADSAEKRQWQQTKKP
ncbi:hypothetical protein MRX96_037357 [Rhipicephalus microplus]